MSTASEDRSVAQSTGPTGSPPLRLIDVVEILIAHSRFVAGAVLLVGLLTAAVSLILPKWYSSETTIFGPEEVSENRRVLSSLKNLSIPGVRQKITSESPETFVAILESRTLRERVIERFDLVDVFDVKNIEECLAVLDKRASVKIENTGIIRVRVEDRDPERSAEIANGIIEELDKINVELRIYRSRRARQYLEGQLNEIRTRLARQEDSLAQFQSENLAVSIPDQARAAVEAIAALEAKAMELRIRERLLGAYTTEVNPERSAVRRELSEIEDEIASSELGNEHGMSFSQLPVLGLHLGQRLRDVKISETLLALLTEDYEQARLDEAKETPVVQVLDRAVPPLRRFKPKRSMLVLGSAGSSLLILLVLIVAVERYEALGSTKDRARWNAILQSLQRWFRRRGR